jgi:hypothetical protein
MDHEKMSDLFDEVLCGNAESAVHEIAGLCQQQREIVLNALQYAEAEADACAGRGPAVRAVLERFCCDV